MAPEEASVADPATLEYDLPAFWPAGDFDSFESQI